MQAAGDSTYNPAAECGKPAVERYAPVKLQGVFCLTKRRIGITCLRGCGKTAFGGMALQIAQRYFGFHIF
jgi:hypothetical protein